MLPAVDDLAVLELEDDAVADIQALAVSLRGAALEADHARRTKMLQKAAAAADDNFSAQLVLAAGIVGGFANLALRRRPTSTVRT